MKQKNFKANLENLPYQVNYPIKLCKIGEEVLCLDSYVNQFTRGKIYTIRKITKEHIPSMYMIHITLDDKMDKDNGWLKKHFIPIKILNSPVAQLLYKK